MWKIDDVDANENTSSTDLMGFSGEICFSFISLSPPETHNNDGTRRGTHTHTIAWCRSGWEGAQKKGKRKYENRKDFNNICMNYDSIKKSYNWGCLLFLCSALLLLPFPCLQPPDPRVLTWLCGPYTHDVLLNVYAVRCGWMRPTGGGGQYFILYLTWMSFSFTPHFSRAPLLLSSFFHSSHYTQTTPFANDTALTLLADCVGVDCDGDAVVRSYTHEKPVINIIFRFSVENICQYDVFVDIKLNWWGFNWGFI